MVNNFLFIHRLRTLRLIFALSAVLLLFTGCSEKTPLAPGEHVSFSRDIMPLFENNCNFPGCHNQVDKQGGIDLTSWNAIMLNGSTFGAEIIPYNSEWSHLMQHVNRVDTNISPFSEPLMPKPLVPYTNGQPLTPDQVRLLEQWINEGARNDNLETAFGNITNKAFITNQASDLIAVVNMENNFLVRLVETGETSQLESPHNVEADRQGRYFYVTLIASGFVEKFDAMTYEKKARLYVTSQPGHVVISNDGAKGYVTNYGISGSREIKCFDTESMTITATIEDTRLTGAHGIKFTSDDSYLVAVSQIGEYLFVINSHTNSIEHMAPVSQIVPPNGNGTSQFQPIAVSLSPDDRYAFVTCTKSNDVRVFDMQTRSFITNIPVGLYPIQSDFTPDGRWCYVANRNSNSVSVIDVHTLSVVKTIPNIGVEPHGVAVTADGRFVYVTCESRSSTYVHHTTTSSNKPGTTAVIDVNRGHIKIKDIEMASYPAGISLMPGR